SPPALHGPPPAPPPPPFPLTPSGVRARPRRPFDCRPPSPFVVGAAAGVPESASAVAPASVADAARPLSTPLSTPSIVSFGDADFSLPFLPLVVDAASWFQAADRAV